MEDLILNPRTSLQLDLFLKEPTHAVALVGAAGIGKGILAKQIAGKILNVPLEKLENYAYFQTYAPVKGVITIEMARDIAQQIKLKTTGKAEIRRVIVIEDAHTMTIEAQNAILKLLEEPPVDTVLILTISSVQAILPTIKSRVQSITLYAVVETEIVKYFENHGYEAAIIKRCYLMSGGLPGLMHAMLEDDTTHPLVQSIDQAKTLLQSDVFTRLTMIDDIAKEKQLDNLLFALKQTAQAALMANAEHAGREKSLEKWTLVLQKTHEAQDLLRSNAQTKLVLTNLFLNI